MFTEPAKLKASAHNLSDIGESARPCSKGVQNNTFSYQFGNLWALIDLDYAERLYEAIRFTYFYCCLFMFWNKSSSTSVI